MVGDGAGYVYITFDDEVQLAAARFDPVGFVADLPKKVILDEVQRAPNLFRSLKATVDRDRLPGRFILTGSTNVLLVPALADSLAEQAAIGLREKMTSGQQSSDGTLPTSGKDGRDLRPSTAEVRTQGIADGCSPGAAPRAEETVAHSDAGGDRLGQGANDASASSGLDASSPLSRSSSRQAGSPLPPAAGYDDETIELLESEVEYLQQLLAERDEQVAQLQREPDRQEESEQDTPATERLVARLEELLDELGRSDQRVRVLEELLRNEQDASRAENSEREEIQRWMGEIERRVAQRESEWRAEQETYERQIEHLKAACDLAPTPRAAAADRSEQAAENEQLRLQLQELRQSLSDAEQEISQWKRRASDAQQAANATPNEKIEQAVRAERLKLAQQRAELSRERAELMRKASEMKSVANHGTSEADQRFMALRETLRDLQEDDRTTSRQKRGLASRLSDLWKRLDGPTDTD